MTTSPKDAKSQKASGSPIRRLRPVGTIALLVECDHLVAVRQLHAHLQNHELPGQIELVPAEQTLLLRFDTEEHTAAAARQLPGLDVPRSALGTGREVMVEVIYDGEDLDDVATATDRSVDEVIRTHTETVWHAGFIGFAPGFSYLVPEAPGGPEAAEVPRRATPRTAVPAGSVALARHYSAVYPRRSPGGWQLIGRTEAELFDVDRDPPALIQPGDTVRFRAVRATASSSAAHSPQPTVRPVHPHSNRTEPDRPAESDASDPPDQTGLIVESPGLLSLLQDRGRPGRAALGLAPSGAADPISARLANHLVDNRAEYGAGSWTSNGADSAGQPPVVEALLGGLGVRARGHQVLALTGADTPATIIAVDGQTQPAPHGAAFALYDRETLTLGEPTAGLRSYLGLRGGIHTELTLGSAATDVMAGLGPKPLAAGTVLHRTIAPGIRAVEHPAAAVFPLPTVDAVTQLHFTWGPRDDRLTSAGTAALLDQHWRVTPASDRSGVRLEPEVEAQQVTTVDDDELPSEPAVTGAIQIPHSGHPVLFLTEHPVTAGYPVIGVIIDDDLPVLGQLPPGALIQFQPVPRSPVTPSSSNIHESTPDE